MRFKVNFTNDIQLIYDLINHEIAEHWATLISQQTLKDCCEINHYLGAHKPNLLSKRIARLYELVDIINQHVPNKIKKLEFTKDTFYNSLNVMHVHFPELEQKQEYMHLQSYLSEYNDTIHWLEPALINHYNNITDNSKFSIKLDFNKVSPPLEKYLIPESAYPLFNGIFWFGQLMLHYVHVGRHAWELFFANDLTCPKEQYVPQSLYNATIRMHFYDNILKDANMKKGFNLLWQRFYNNRGGKDFFDCDINDPKIRFGYCEIGQLSEIILNSKKLDLPQTTREINAIRNLIVENEIIDWEII